MGCFQVLSSAFLAARPSLERSSDSDGVSDCEDGQGQGSRAKSPAVLDITRDAAGPGRLGPSSLPDIEGEISDIIAKRAIIEAAMAKPPQLRAKVFTLPGAEHNPPGSPFSIVAQSVLAEPYKGIIGP